MTDTDRAIAQIKAALDEPFGPITCAETELWFLLDRLDAKDAEIERLREAGIGYSQQTVDALTAERDELRRKLAESEQRFDWLTERLEDVQIDDVDPNDHYYDGEEDVPFPILWRRAIDAAMGLTRPAEES